jgi:flagellar biosynthesis protein FliR
MKTNSDTIGAILKAVAFGMAAAVLVLNVMKVVTAETSIILLSMGVLALSMVSLRNEKKTERT